MNYQESTFRSRDAAGELRRQFVRLIRDQQPTPGTKLLTEAELVDLTGVSRSTIRRALGPLEKDGWIDRRAGSGTFIGERIRELLGLQPAVILPTDSRQGLSDQLRVRRSRGIVRVAVLIYNIGDLAHDWYTPGVLGGLDDAGDDHQIVVELLGDHDGDVGALSRRLELSHPDALVVLSNQPRHAFVIRDAQQKLGIACFVSGTALRGLDVPMVAENNRQAMAIAVEHLLGRGFKRIGVSLARIPEVWVFERHESFIETGREKAGGPHVSHWFTSAAEPTQRDIDGLYDFIKSNQIDALIPAHLTGMLAMDALVKAGRLRVPEDLSVISFEQDQPERKYMAHPDATRIALPLKQMGQTLARLARATIEGQPVPNLVELPAELVQGTTVSHK